MAGLAIVMSIITGATTATSVLGTVQRRCGASQEFTELVSLCHELVKKIQTLLKTLEAGLQVPKDMPGISLALNHRREEFDEILRNLEKINRRIKRTQVTERTEKYIAAQGWIKKMEAILNDLRYFRNGIELIVISWDAAPFVVNRVEEIATIDLTKRDGPETWEKHAASEIIGSDSVNYVDRMLMTMVKLTDANKSALNRFGNLESVELPVALFAASLCVFPSDEACSIQLIQRSAELLHPEANWWMGRFCKWGFDRVEKNLDSALFHFRVASSRDHLGSMFTLIEHYENANDQGGALKYSKMASKRTMKWQDWIGLLHYTVANASESARIVESSIAENKFECAILHSILHFFGVGVPKSEKRALKALQIFDSGSYSLHFQVEDMKHSFASNRFFGQSRKFESSYSRFNTAVRDYENFLMKENQFLPLLTFSHGFNMFLSM